MSRLCTLCARGGSKGVPNKNLRLLAGKPLIAHSLVQARQSGLFDLLAVSSDSPAILDAAAAWGADLSVLRPAEMATDTAAKLPAIRHCVVAAEVKAGYRFDTICDLDATAPLRSVDDIRGAVALLESGEACNVITGMPARRSPYFNLVERDDRGRVHLAKTLDRPVMRRQDAPACFDMNASIYVWRRDALMDGGDGVIGAETLLFVMPEERSIDIDSETDFRFVEFLMAEARSPA